MATKTVYCSSCGGEFHVDPHRAGGFSHCEDHAGLINHEDDDCAFVITAADIYSPRGITDAHIRRIYDQGAK